MMRVPSSGPRPGRARGLGLVGKLAALGAALGVSILGPPAARANLQAFSPGTLIIPMDACYQAAPDEPMPAGCVSGKAAPDDGAVKAYGLVHALLRKGVSVYLAIDPAKTALDAPDFSVVGDSSNPPVLRLDRASGSAAAFAGADTVVYRGGPMLIDAAEADRVRALLGSDPDLAPFSSTAIHVAGVTFNADVSLRLQGTPPRLAIIDPCDGALGCDKGGPPSSESIPVMRAYLRRAGLDQPGDVGTFAAAGRVADVVTLNDIVTRNALSVGNYQIVWLPHYLAPTLSAGAYQLLPADLTALLRLTGFVGAGGVLLGQSAAVLSLEGGNDRQGIRFAPPAEVGHYLFTDPTGGYLNLLGGCYPGNAAGFGAECVGPTAPVAPPSGQALAFDEPANPLAQLGDFHFYDGLNLSPLNNVNNIVGNWDVQPGGTWKPEVAHLVRSNDAAQPTDHVDMLSLVRTPAGQVLYLGGQSYAEPTRASTAGMRLVLSSLLFSRPTRNVTEQARSGPIVAADGKIYQGSYRESSAPQSVYTRATDAATWTFPQVIGHLREYPQARFPSGTDEALGTGGATWDAATRMPDGASRRVLIQQDSSSFGEFSYSNRGAFRNRLGLPSGYTDDDVSALVTAVRAGPLGGIDHSTLALVPPTGIVPSGATRPTMAYVGALDGQLHAFVVSGGAVAPGTELWSFIPRDQLPLLRTNSAGVDASPNVRDVFDDWARTGVRSWRTYLAIGAGAYGKMVHAIDVSDPSNPQLRWQRGSSGANLGNARGATWAMVTRAAAPAGLVSELVVATNRASGKGASVFGLWGVDGTTLWRYDLSYTGTVPGSSQIIPNDMPGSPAVVDLSDRGSEDRVYFADYQGRVWELDAATGANLLSGYPLYDVGPTPQGNVQPIGAPLAVYRDTFTRHVVVVAATGGADWASPTDTYAVYAIDAEAINPDTGRRGQLLFRTEVPGRVYAAPTIAGNDVYVLASSGALGGYIAGTLGEGGTMARINLTTHQTTLTQAVEKGAGALLTTGDGRIVGSTVRDITAVSNAGSDTRSTALADIQRMFFRAWLEPL